MADDREQRSLELPSLWRRRTSRKARVSPPAWLASGLTGLVAGALVAGLVRLGVEGCSALRDTSSCGGLGLVGLLVILAVALLTARAALLRLGVPASGSTAGLGTALLAVVAVLTSWVDDVAAMAPAGALTFAVASWVARTNTQPGERPR